MLGTPYTKCGVKLSSPKKGGARLREYQPGHWANQFACSHPPVNPGAQQAIADKRTIPHKMPKHAVAVIFDHQHDRPLVETDMPGGGLNFAAGICLICAVFQKESVKRINSSHSRRLFHRASSWKPSSMTGTRPLSQPIAAVISVFARLAGLRRGRFTAGIDGALPICRCLEKWCNC